MFLREASKRGYAIEDIVALLDEAEMTADEAVARIIKLDRPTTLWKGLFKASGSLSGQWVRGSGRRPCWSTDEG